ncbi:MAG: efflux RND transporter permease subunit, partial [Gemmatimonadetes bacterium]|nr:efflux RND transporter permease subunit [Gemmatimonadota bacterium]
EGQTEYLVRTLNEFASLAQIGDLIVARNAGADIRLRDIAEVSRGHKDREIITRVNGRESVELEIYKEADANIVAVAEAVKQRIHGNPVQQAYVSGLAAAALDSAAIDSALADSMAVALADSAHGNDVLDESEAQAGDDEAAVESDLDEDESDEVEADGEGAEGQGNDLKAQKQAAARQAILHLQMTDFLAHQMPDAIHLEVLSDQSVFIVNSIEEVKRSALIGGAMAVVVLLIFLRNVMHTLVIAVTIPVSVIATFAPMFLFDVSLNIMSLGGLALGVGMLVDNSIVVLESIFRCREEGDDLLTATVRGTGEVGGAVFASTLTTIAVFFPIVFVEGVAGQVFGDMALTVVFSLLASLAVALFFIPMLASRRPAQTHALVDQLRQTQFLQPRSRVRLRMAFGQDGELPLLQRLREAGLVIPQILLDLVVRLLLVVASLLVVILKVVAAVLFQIAWPVVRLVEVWRPSAKGPTYERVRGWMAATQPLRGLRDAVWPGLLDVTTLDLLAQDAGRVGHWVWRRPASWWRWSIALLRGVATPIAIAYLLVRFVLDSALSLVRAALVSVLLLLALLVVCVASLLSLLVVPVAAPILGLFQLGLDAVQRGYPILLRAALKQRLLVVAGAAVSFWACYTQLVPALGTELIPQVHQGQFNLELSMPVGTPLARTEQVAQWVEGIAVEIEDVDRVATTVGSDNSATSTADEGEHTARITVRLRDEVTLEEEAAVIDALRRGVRNLPEVETEISYPSLFSFKTPIELEIRGENLRILRQLSVDAVGRLSELPGLADVRSSLQVGHPELQIVYSRDRLAELGLDLRRVAELVRNKVQGRVATDFRQSERNIDVMVRLREDDRLGVAELERLIVNPDGNVPIRLSSVADIRIAEGPSEIRRIDQQRAALVTANINGIDLGTAADQIVASLQEADYPAGFSYLISGQREEMERSLDSLVFALLLAIFLVYIVMASQFESLIHPFVIMFTVPLAAIGAIAVLYLKGVALSIVVFIGFIMLAGIVVN